MQQGWKLKQGLLKDCREALQRNEPSRQLAAVPDRDGLWQKLPEKAGGLRRITPARVQERGFQGVVRQAHAIMKLSLQ